MKAAEIISLDERTHILQLPEMYIGSMSNITSEEFIYADNKIRKEQIEYIPALLKIINEAIDNSLDEAIKTNFKYGNRIRVSIDDYEVSIEDNGRGVPVIKSEDTNEFMPIMAFCNVRAGSNFNKKDDGSFSIGTHGIGIKATNIFSKKFEAETADGKNRLTLVCKNNLETYDYSIRKITTNYTKIKFTPDLERFGLTKIKDIYKQLIEQRLLFLSYSFPKVKFYFNDKRVSIANEKQFMNLFNEHFELFSTDKWFIGVLPNEEEEFSYFTYVNGLFLKRGGNHIDMISLEISYRIRDALSKKYKTIKPADVKNKISLVVFFREFPSMKFDSQTKETLTNSGPEIKKYMDYSSDDFQNMSRKILRNSEIIDSIVEMFKLKEEFKKRRELKRISSNTKKITSDSYFSPIGKKKYLMLTEGFSATSSMLNILGRKEIAYYSLRGKPLNTYNVTIARMVKNKEFQEIVDILGIDLLDKDTDMDFEKVVFLADADTDGTHIRSLLLTFFYKFTPKMLEDGRILFMNTPLVIVFDSKNNPIRWFYTIDDYNNAIASDEKLRKRESKYYKGLGSLSKNIFSKILEKEGSLDKMLIQFKNEECSKQSIKDWMSPEGISARKENLIGKSFNLSSI